MPCAASALLTILATYWLGRRLVGNRAAWLGAIALLLCGGFVLSGRFLIMDGPLTLWTTVAALKPAKGRLSLRLADARPVFAVADDVWPPKDLA